MTAAEALLLLIIVVILFFVLYFLLKDTTGRVEVTRPIESRIDEYLDQRFEDLVREWSLVTRPKLGRFKREKSSVLDQDEIRVAEMKSFETEMKKTLNSLEERLDALEKELAKAGKGKGRKRKT